MGNPKAFGHTRALQWLGLEFARPIMPDQEIARTSAHPAGSVEEQNSGHTFIVHLGARSVTAWRADMTDVILSTVSPAYSAVRSTADSGIPIVGAMGENIGRLGVCILTTGMVTRGGDGTGQLRARQATTHSGLGDRNVKAKSVQQVH
ncbi:MAG: hypothetical protein JWQ31_1075 [Mycobacterium sp.]|nr:hypothetical protein [Mycobacterium sp.]